MLYRVGDFFEVLGKDAKDVAKWTDTTLTGRNDPNAGRVDMVGFPFHMLEKYVEKIRTQKDVTLVQEEGGVIKEYPMATLESSNINDTDGGITNVTERTEKKVAGRANESDAGSNEGTSSQVGDGRGVSEGLGEKAGIHKDTLRLRDKQQEISGKGKPFSEDSYIKPRKNSVEEAEGKILDEYGIEWYVVKKDKWTKDAPAWAYYGKVYMQEGIEETFRGAIARHEATHIMKQLEFKSYLDLLELTPDRLNMSTEDARDLIQQMAEHCNVDVFNATDDANQAIYDELNSALYGDYYQSYKDEEYLSFFLLR